jgi:hypothetical protein
MLAQIQCVASRLEISHTSLPPCPPSCRACGGAAADIWLAAARGRAASSATLGTQTTAAAVAAETLRHSQAASSSTVTRQRAARMRMPAAAAPGIPAAAAQPPAAGGRAPARAVQLHPGAGQGARLLAGRAHPQQRQQQQQQQQQHLRDHQQLSSMLAGGACPRSRRCGLLSAPGAASTQQIPARLARWWCLMAACCPSISVMSCTHFCWSRCGCCGAGKEQRLHVACRSATSKKISQ